MTAQFICLDILSCLWPRDGVDSHSDSQSITNLWVSMIFGALLDLDPGNGCSYPGVPGHPTGIADSPISPNFSTTYIQNPHIHVSTVQHTITIPLNAV